MLIVRATKKLLARLGPPTLQDGEHPTTLLGQWYATALHWRPQVALLVNEPTLLPVLMPLAPAATLLARVPAQVATVLAAHGTPQPIIDDELQRMCEHRVAGTANRSVVGIMNELTFLATADRTGNGGLDLLDLSARLATTPCSPLYRQPRPRTHRPPAFGRQLTITTVIAHRQVARTDRQPATRDPPARLDMHPPRGSRK